MAGQTVAMLTSITAITNATAVLIIEVDVLNRISVGNIWAWLLYDDGQAAVE